MAKKKEEIVEEEVESSIAPLTQSFSNGELNVLKDKINELVARS